MKKQIVIAGLSLLLISGCVTGKRNLSEMSQLVEATQDIQTAPELGTAVSGDYIIAGDNDDAAGARLSRIVLDGVATNCLSGAGTLVPCGGDLVNDTTPQLGGNLDIQTFNIEGVDATEFGYLDGTTSDIQTQFDLKAPLASPDFTGTLFLAEQADAAADVAGSGQIWVNTATPNELWFTDDAGTDTQLGVGGAGTGDLLANGTIPMTADWAFGAFDITGIVDITASGEVAAGTFSSPATASGPQFTLFYEDSDEGGHATGIAAPQGDVPATYLTSDPNAVPAAGQIKVYGVPASGNLSDNVARNVAASTWAYQDVDFCVAISDETTALTTGTAKISFRSPYAFTLTAVRTSAVTAPTGATLTLDINEAGTTVLSTKLTIDVSELTSVTAATPPVISDSAIADDALLTIDIDQIGSTIAGAGAKVCLYGTRGF